MTRDLDPEGVQDALELAALEPELLRQRMDSYTRGVTLFDRSLNPYFGRAEIGRALTARIR